MQCWAVPLQLRTRPCFPVHRNSQECALPHACVTGSVWGWGPPALWFSGAFPPQSAGIASWWSLKKSICSESPSKYEKIRKILTCSNSPDLGLVVFENWSTHGSPDSWLKGRMKWYPWSLKMPYFSWFSNSFPSSLLHVHYSVQSLSRVRLFVTPWTAARQASLSITNSQSPSNPMSIELVMPSNHLILCHPLLLLPSIFPRVRVFKLLRVTKSFPY